MELQRASAGSGKTFHLAKIFIRDFLTYHRDEDASKARAEDKVWENSVRRYILRSPEEIIQSHSHILAITFTNKATNEMKERVVEKLADLARGHRLEKRNDGSYKPAEYMQFFLEETLTSDGISPTEEQVKEAATAGLAELLNNYTDFNISTIDSFFQQILRTFAYELDLNDNLELELDSDFLNSMGVDMTLKSANRPSDPDHEQAKAWLNSLIRIYQTRAAKWDILGSGAREPQLHKELMNIANKASSENFHNLLSEIRRYFRSTNWNKTGLTGMDCFRRYHNQTIVYYDKQRRKAWDECQKAVNLFERECTNNGVGKDDLTKGVDTAIYSFRTTNEEVSPTAPATQIFKNLIATDACFDIVFKSKSKASPQARRIVGDAAIAAARKGIEFINACNIYEDITSRLFFVGLLGLISDNTERYRDSNNLMPLADTGNLLHGIVQSQKDAPFIFERMGAMLHHFLIDEFQDTSKTQWEVMLPLIQNADSEQFDNLIIGDAKQSIYRFRDAEPELISYEVEKEFPYTNARAQITPNTNWRSSHTVVEFNNCLFEHLADDIDRTITQHQGITRRSPKPIYSNVRQAVHHSDAEGYVQVTFSDTSTYINELGSLIESLRNDGWQQRDIAVLCNTNAECHRVISSLLAHNMNPDVTPIEIVSEEALSVAESNAVKMILAVLTMIRDGNLHTGNNTSTQNEEITKEGKVTAITRQDLEVLAATQLEHGEIDNASQIAGTINASELISAESIGQMLNEMPAISLPALVEAIIVKFVPKRLHTSDCAYIAAFQDCVLDFCEKYPADTASFLRWWNESGYKVNIAAPEGSDAVNVMTIHKSKGLEYGVVIIPYAGWDIDISKRSESVIWVKPTPDTCDEKAIMPPAIPIKVGTAHELTGTPYAQAYLEEYDRSRIDNMNKAYVGFTRAAGELYINTKLAASAMKDLDKGKPNDSVSLGVYLYKILLQMAQEGQCKHNSTSHSFISGTRGIAAGNKDFHKKAAAQEQGDTIAEYYVNSPMPRLRAVQGDDLQGRIDDTNPSPRDYGTQLHAVMAGMDYPEDLERSIIKMRVRGLIDEATSGRIRQRINQALKLPQVKEWFAPCRQIFTERTILRGGTSPRRPDRIVDTGDKIIVIDYKTGNPAGWEEYSLQLRRYMGLYHQYCEERGMKRAIEGHLLYIPADDKLPCSTHQITP